MSEKTITINGVGFVTTVSVEDGESVSDALIKAGLDPSELDVNVDAESPAGDSPEVVATPKEARLG